MNGDAKSLPADVTQVIFNALNLDMGEKKEVIPLLNLNLNCRRHLLALNPPTSTQMPLPSRKSCSPGVEGKDEVEGGEERAEVGEEIVLPTLVLEEGRMAW